MDKLRKYRKNLIIVLSVLLVLMLSIGVAYGKYTSSRMSVIDLTVKHTVTLTLDVNLPEGKTSVSGIDTTPVVLTEESTGDDAKVVYPNLPLDELNNTENPDDLSGKYLVGWYLEGWYLDQACTYGKEVKAGQEITVEKDDMPATEVTLYAKWKKVELQELGGDIFYMDPDVDGAIYKFYKEDEDHNKVEINLASVSPENVVSTLRSQEVKYYLKVGNNSNTTGDITKDYKKDKFYVVANDGNTTKILIGEWGNPDIDETSAEIGKGMANTKVIMSKLKREDEESKEITYPENTIWKLLNDFITDEKNTNKDWYIGSKEEMEKYKDYENSLLPTWEQFWSSTKLGTSPMKIVYWNRNRWDEITQTNEKFNAIPMRSF